METTVDDDSLRRNYALLILGAILAFVILLSKIWYLQIIKGGEFNDAAEANRIRHIRLVAPRGIVYDRERRVLATNKPSFDVYFHPPTIRGQTDNETHRLRLTYLEQVSEQLGVDFSVIKKRFNQAKGVLPIKIKTDISWEEVARIKSMSMYYQGEPPLSINDETKRAYNYKELLSHSLGYISEIDEKRLESPEYAGYRPGDFVGRVGIEEKYEPYLKGQIGEETAEENARRVKLRTIDITPPVPGMSLVLNMDVDLAETAARAMGVGEGMAGAVVALDVKTGGVLCAVSFPGFDPEIFSRVLPSDTWNTLINDPKKPLTNKVISNAYPPGSAWKVVTAIAGLESEAVKPDWKADCAGKWRFGNRDFRCWSAHGHGTMTVKTAIIHSCDVFFYKLGLKAGIDEMAKWARLLGAGEKTGVDMTPETSGTVPDRKWKEETMGEPWFPGETPSCAIGQGYNLVSPIQLALIYSSFANGGTVYRPQMVNRIEDPEGRLIKQFEPEAIRKLEWKKKNRDLIVEGLVGAVNAPGGTGGRARLKSVLVAGKTGTAQITKIKATRTHITAMEYKHRDHAWFACFAPAEEPEIAVVVLAEHSGHGGVASAPVARAVLATYFDKKHRQQANPALQNPEPEPQAQADNAEIEGD